MRPEIELMLRCARNWSDKEADARISELLKASVDWEYLLRIANRHRMQPFLHWNLKDTSSSSVPTSVRERLKGRFMANARTNLLALGRMMRLLSAFEVADIPVIAFKGPISTYGLYGIPGLREFTDLDLLVNPDDVARSISLLIANGLHEPIPLNTTQMKAVVRFRNELSFSSRGAPIHIDLHWKLLITCYDLRVNHHVLWRRSAHTMIEDRPVRTLSSSDFLYYLTRRAALDSWSSLYRIVDIAVALRTTDQDAIQGTLDRASAVGKLRPLLVGLFLVRDLLDTDITKSGLSNLRFDRTGSLLIRRSQKRLEMRPEYQPGLIERMTIGAFALNRFRDKVCILLWLLFSPGPADVRFFSLPNSMFWLYRIIRFFRAAVKFSTKLIHHPKRKQ